MTARDVTEAPNPFSGRILAPIPQSGSSSRLPPTTFGGPLRVVGTYYPVDSRGQSHTFGDQSTTSFLEYVSQRRAELSVVEVWTVFAVRHGYTCFILVLHSL
jgi:hypothetical protein